MKIKILMTLAACVALAVAQSVPTQKSAYKLITDGNAYRVSCLMGTNEWASVREFRTRDLACGYRDTLLSKSAQERSFEATQRWFQLKRRGSWTNVPPALECE